MNNTNFVIVTFVDEDDAPGIVAANWIKPNGNTSYYPNVRTEEMKNKLLRRMVEPEDTWPQYQIKVLKSYETYGEARLHLKKAEETSNLESDDEMRKRKRKIKKMYLPEDSTSSSDDYPVPKVSKLQQNITKKKPYISRYPIPPKPVAKQTALAKEVEANVVEVCNDVAMGVNSAVGCPINPSAVLTEPVPSGSNSYLLEFSPNTCSIKQPKDGHLYPNPNSAVNYLDALAEEDESGTIQAAVSCSPGPSTLMTVPFGSNQENLPKRSKLCNNSAVNCPSDCVISKRFAIQQSHLIQVVTDLTSQMVELNRKVDLLLGRSGESSSQTEDAFAVPDFLSNLPVKDDESFCGLNDLLKINQNRQAIIKYLAGIGGRNVRSLMTNMLRRVLLDDVAELYSLTGKQMKNSSKKAFLTTETCKIMFQICKKIYEDVTDEKLKEISSDWLNQAKVRITRRAERQRKH